MRWVPLAEIARPHGVRGELRLKVFNEASDLLARRPPVRLRLPDGSERDATIHTVRPTNKALLVVFEGVTGRDAAEALRGAKVLVSRDRFPAAEEGEFYACDLEGARALLEGVEIGTVTELRSYPTCDVLVVTRPPPAPPLEVPLVDAFVADVDTSAGVVTLRTIEGL